MIMINPMMDLMLWRVDEYMLLAYDLYRHGLTVVRIQIRREWRIFKGRKPNLKIENASKHEYSLISL